ncbi:MAG: long-chain acyl-CoA synthetase, partial [Blastococcus sp.]|nr:long-chain acyl-CoA synthetase [Blastococcus sp.]
MREFSVPATTEIGPDEAVPDLLATNVAEYGDQVGLRRRVDGQWRDVTWKEFGGEVASVAKGLIASGVEAGDRVALQAKTRYEWTVLDFAIWAAGGVVVPIYDSSSADQVAWILSDSGASALIVETAEHADAVDSIRSEAPDLKSVFVIDDGAVDQLVSAGSDVADSELDERRATLKADTVATLIYTSGTTGRPKGCELTHSNFLFEIENGMTLLGKFLNVDGSILLFIPLAHVLARVIEVGSVKTRTVIGHTPDV